MEIDIQTDLTRRQLFVFYVLFGLIMMWIFLTINVRINAFNFTHFTFNYEHEFVKRGLVGEVLRLSGLVLTYERVLCLSRIMFSLVFLSMLYMFFKPVYKTPKRTGYWLFFLMAILHPVIVQHFYFDLGRFDGLGLSISLLAIVLISRLQKLTSYLVVPMLLVISILIHEGAFFAYIPFVFGYWIYKDHRVSSLFFKSLIFILLILATYFISTNGLVQTMSFDEHYSSLVNLYGADLVDRPSLNALHGMKGVKENFFYTMQSVNKFTIKYHLLMFIIFLPFSCILLDIIINAIKTDGYKWRLFFIGSSFSPLLLYPLGIDFYRWWALALRNVLLAIAILTEDSEFSDLLCNTMFENRELVFITILSSILSGPLAVTFPFPRLQ